MNRNILLVEDDVKYRRSTILHLTAKNQDYVFYEAFSVSEAIEILNRENIQVILLDYKLSGNEEGTELLKYVKDLEKEYRVIFLTAYAPPDDLDVYIYLPKDLGPEPLSNAVENAFDDLQVTEEKKNIHKLAEAPLDMTPSKKPETDIVSEHRRPAPQAAPVAAHLHSDKWTLDDQLGYSLYAKGITEFMFHEQTKPPLTIGILAPWGHGKTTLMRLIEDEIVIEDELKETTAKHTRTTDVVKTPSRASGATYSNLSEWIESSRSLSLDSLKHLDRLKHPTIWFNAWKFQNSEQLWAGLAQAIITQLVDQIPDAIDREKFWFLLQAERIDFNKIRRDIHKAVLEQFLPSLARWCIVGLLGIAILIASAILGPALGGVLKLFGLGTGVLSLIGSIISWSKSKKKMLEKSLEGKFVRYVSEPGYEEKMGYFAEVERDVRRVFKLLVDEEKPAVVFVDDLDRCSPGKTAEVIEAINLFLSGDFPTCYFVMGMDAQVVAASLDVAHEKLAHRLKPMTRSYGSLGWYFMEKIVQLPFVIPNLSENQ